MIPLPVVSTAISYIISIWFRHKEETRREEQERRMARIKQDEITEQSNRHRAELEARSKGLQWTKRYLAILPWTIYWGIKLGLFFALLFGVEGVFMSYMEPVTTHHGFWIFSWSKTSMEFIKLPGIPFTSFDYHMLGAIVGNYFGLSPRR